MARKIELEVQVDGIDKINKDLDKLETSLKEMKSQLQNMDSGTAEFQQLSKAIQDTETRLNSLGESSKKASQEQASLNQQIGDAEDKLMLMAAAGDTSSAAYKKLLSEVGQMKKVQMETNIQIDNAAKGFTGKLTLGIQRVAASYQLAMAATQMFGVESEKAQKIMAQLQAVMAFTQGLEQIKQLTVGMKLFGQGGVAAMSSIQKAIVATGIGALVVAVGLLVAYWEDIVNLISGGASEQAKLVEQSKQNVELKKKELEIFDSQVNSLKLQGKSEKEILELRMAKIDALIEEQKVFVAAMEEKSRLEVENAKQNQEIAQGIIRGMIEFSTFTLRLMVAPIDLLIETANSLAEALGFDKITTTNLNNEISKLNENLAQTAATFLFDPEKVAAEGQKAIDEAKTTLRGLESERDGMRLQIQNIEKQEAEESIKNAEERAAKLKEIRTQELEIIKAIEARKLEAVEAGIDAEIAAMTDGVEKQKLLLERQYGKEKQALIDASHAQELAALDEKFTDGLLSEAAYLDEVKKLRSDETKLTDEERNLLLRKEAIKNAEIVKLEKDASDKKAAERKRYLDYVESQETDARQREINAAEKSYADDIAKLQQFLNEKTITQEEFDNDQRERAQKLADDLAEIDKKYRNETLSRLQSGFSTIAAGFDMLKEGAAGLFGSIGSSLASGLSQIMEVGKMKFDEFDTQLQNTSQKVAAYAQAVGGMIQSVLGAVSEEQKARLEENLTRVEETYDTEMNALQQQKDQGLITEQQFAQKKYQLDLKRYNEEEKLRKAAFESEKGMKIASAITAGLMGAVSAFAGAMQLGPIAGPVVGALLAAAVAAMTAVNVSQIASTQYKGGTPPSAPSIAGGVEGAGAAVQGAMTAPTPSVTTLFGAPMTGGNQGGQGQEAGQRQQPMRAYVLETDISTVQNTISTYEQRAEIG